MPVIIRHIQLKTEKQVGYGEWCKIDNGVWELIMQWDIVQLEHFQYWDKQWVNHHIMEKSEALDRFIKPFSERYRYKDLPDIDNRIKIGIHNFVKQANRSLLAYDESDFVDKPIINPKTNPTTPHKLKIMISNILLFKYFKKLSIKNIIEMIIAGVIAAIIIWYFKYNDIRH